jgi:glycine oxidase
MSEQVIVVGGGIAGCAVAVELRQRGIDVMVLDRDQPGSGATGASAGMLAPQYESVDPDAAFRFGSESMALWPAFARTLESLTDWPIGHRTSGMLVANRTSEEEDRARRALAWQAEAGMAGEILSPEDARQHHPGIGTDFPSYTWLPEEAQVDVQRLAVGLADAVRGAGGRIRAGKGVQAILSEKGRASGVLLDNGTRMDAAAVVLAAGAWTPQIEGIPESLPVRPVRGQILRLLPSSPPPWTLLADHRGRYLVPRENGTLLVGSTMEEAGYRDEVTDEARASIIDSALELFPGLEDAKIVERWAGLRPITPDAWPLLGPEPSLPGLHYATGYGRHGILFAPLASRVVVDLLLNGATEHEWEPFGVERFREDG